MLRLLLMLSVFAAVLGGAAIGQESRGYLGIDLQDVTKEEADRLGWDAPRGAKVRNVEPGSPAEKAGLKAGDIVLSLDRTEIDNAADLDASVDGKRAGTELRLRVLSRGRELRVAAVLGERQRVVATGEAPILQLDTGGHMAFVKGLAFTPDGKHIVSAGDDKVIRVWDWRAGTTVRSIRGQAGPGHEGKVFAMALSQDGRWLAAGGWMHPACVGRCGDIRLYEFATGRLAAVLKGHTDVVNGLAFAPDGNRLISGSSDATAIIWDVEKRAPAHHLKGHTERIAGVVFSLDGTRSFTGSYDKTLKLWSVADGKLITTLSGHSDRVWSLAVSDADGSIASGSGDGEIRLWDGGSGQFLRTLAQQGGIVGVLKFSPDGTRLLSTCSYGGCNRIQRVRDVATGKELVAYGGHDNIVHTAALSRDGQLVTTGGGNNQEIHLWNIQTGQLERRLSGKGAPGWAAAFSADGRHLAWGNTTSREPSYRAAGELEGSCVWLGPAAS